MKNWLLLNKTEKVIHKVCLVTSLVIVFSLNLRAQQNLVPNNSFEFHLSFCPNISQRITTSYPWFQPNNYFGNVDNSCSTDYYHLCSTNLSNSIPNNNHGYHLPRTDSAYSGFVIYGGINYREYLETPLIDTTTKTHKYCLSLYVLLSRSSKYGTNGLSATFTVDSLLDSSPSPYPPINVVPQINFNSIFILDTTNWVKLEGSFIANDNYKFLTIGNFKNDASTNSVLTGFGTYNGTYIFVDDVELKEIFDSKTVNDTLINNPASILLGLNTDTTALYEWWPHTGIADTNEMNPVATVNQTTMYYVRKTQCGEVSIDSVLVIVSPIGLKDWNAESNKFIVYPNPNSGNFQIRNESGTSFSGSWMLMDVYGKLIKEESIYNKQQIDVNVEKETEKGVYFFKLYDENHNLVFAYKIILQ